MLKRSLWINPNLLGGLLALALGAFVLNVSADYPRGSVLRMGPGFFPTMLGILLLAFGALLLASGALRRGDRIIRPELRALIFILGALAAFGLVLPRFGLAPAIVLLVLISSAASPTSRPLQALVLAVSLAVIAWLIFVVILSLPLPMFVW